MFIPCYKYELMGPNKGIVNLPYLKIMFDLLFEEIEFIVNAKSSMDIVH